MRSMHRGSGLVLGIIWLLMADLTANADTEVPPFGVFTMLEGQDVEYVMPA